MGFDMGTPEQAELGGCVEHAGAVLLELCQVQHDRGGGHFVQGLADEAGTELLLELGVDGRCCHGGDEFNSCVSGVWRKLVVCLECCVPQV